MTYFPSRLSRTERNRIERARVEVGQTTVEPRVAYSLVVVFMAIILVVPLTQAISDFGFYQRVAGAFKPVAAPTLDSKASHSVLSTVITSNRKLLEAIQTTDNLLEDDSFIARVVRPQVQYLMTAWLGASTEQVQPGKAGWLFYGSDLAHVTGNGFLTPSHLVRRRASGDTLTPAPQPDPLLAIIDLHTQLAQRSIQLIVLPTPVKLTIHPERLSRSNTVKRRVITNPSYPSFLAELRSHGVLVFGTIAELTALKQQMAAPVYLATDTHWRPETVEHLADRLAAFIDATVNLPETDPVDYRVTTTDVINRGDTLLLLNLPSRQSLYPSESVSVRQIRTADSGPWQADRNADVLLLGDSFTNVYSLETMGWGTSAGLAEQLSFALRRQIDRLSQNDNGAFATRELLAAELRRGRDRLAGKRLVIYQFANRELSLGDWKLVDLTLSTPDYLSAFLRPSDSISVNIRGTVLSIGPIPRPGSVPYRDHIVAIHLNKVAVEADAGLGNKSEALVYVRSMTDGELTPVANYRPGDTIELRLEPWENVAAEFNGINRGEVTDPTVLLAEPWWGQLVQRGGPVEPS